MRRAYVRPQRNLPATPAFHDDPAKGWTIRQG
jgi:hypothetical protein